MDSKSIQKLRETAIGEKLIDWLKEVARSVNTTHDIDPTLPDAEFAREARARAIASLKLAEILQPLIENVEDIVNVEDMDEETRLYYGVTNKRKPKKD